VSIRPGIDGVHTDALPDVFKCSRPRQADHAMLGSDIGTDAGIAGQDADKWAKSRVGGEVSISWQKNSTLR
jgi:hypothetical protein